MEYELIQAGTSKERIRQYSQFLSMVFPVTKKFTPQFLHWQYFLNPRGTIVGFDAWQDGQLAAHYATIPVVYRIDKKLVKGLLSLNTATHPHHRGRGLFTQLALKTYQLGKESGYEFVIGVANRNSTYGLLANLGFYLISPMEVIAGIGKIWPHEEAEYRLMSEWNHEALNWRLSNPESEYYHCKKNIYSKTGKPMIYAQVTGRQGYNFSGNLPYKKSIPFTLWIGLMYYKKIHGLVMKFPDVLKPSPLNMVFKDLSGTLPVFKKEEVFFELLDFDAY